MNHISNDLDGNLVLKLKYGAVTLAPECLECNSATHTHAIECIASDRLRLLFDGDLLCEQNRRDVGPASYAAYEYEVITGEPFIPAPAKAARI